MSKKLKDGIYAKSCQGEQPKLMFRKAIIDGRLSMAYVKVNTVLAAKDWEEANREMFSPGPCLIVDSKSGKLSFGVM